MQWTRKTIMLLGFFILGCSQGSPTITATEDLPAIELDQNFFQSKSLELFDISLKGKISKFVERLEVSFDGGASWNAIQSDSASSLQIEKASCTVICNFKFGILNVGQQWPMLMQLPVDSEAAGLLRGYSVYGFTAAAAFRIRRLKSGYFSVGSAGKNNMGDGARKTASHFYVEGARIESRGRTSMTGGTMGAGVVK